MNQCFSNGCHETEYARKKRRVKPSMNLKELPEKIKAGIASLKGGEAGSFTFTAEDSAAFCTSLGYLMRAGLTAGDALTILAGDEQRAPYKEAIKAMAEAVEDGQNLSDAVTSSGCLPGFVGEMIAVGERTGRLDEALEALALDCDDRAATDRRLRSALAYPALLLLIMLAVIGVLLIYVLPVFDRVYSQLGSGLTGFAGALMRFGVGLGKIRWLLVAVFVLIAGAVAVFSFSQRVRDRMISAWQRKRGDKGIASALSGARFARALSLCMSSGLFADEAVETASALLGEGADDRGKRCLELVNEGNSVATALRESNLLPAAKCTLLEAGVRSGAGETAMARIAEQMSDEAGRAVEGAVSKVEPAIVIAASLLVGIILIAVMLPLVNIMAALG